MKNIFGEEMMIHTPKQNIDAVGAFLGAAGHMPLSKTSLSICSYIAKDENKLWVTDINSFLVMPYTGNEEKGAYNYITSKAFKKLDGFSTDITLETFPKIEIDLANREWMGINDKQAQLMLDAFNFISDDITRYFMCGIHFNDGYVIATDGRRLFYAPGFDKFPEVILPDSKTLAWLLKKGINIKYKIDTKYSVFQFEYKGSTLFYCNPNIESQFPNWKKVVPEKQRYAVQDPDIIAWAEIHNRIKQLKTKETTERIFIKPDTDNLVLIEWEGRIVGSMRWKGLYDKDRLENEKMEWDAIENAMETPETPKKEFTQSMLAINYKYLNDILVLKKLKEIRFTKFEKPLTFIYEDSSECIVMPMLLT